MDTIPGLDLTEAIDLLARRRAAEDGYIWDHTPELWANLGQFQSEYLAEAKGVLEHVAPIIERQVLARAARTLDWLDLTGATVLVLEDGAKVLFAFHQHLNTETAIDRVRRLQDSLPRHVVAIVVDGTEYVSVDEYPQKEKALQ